MRIKYQKKTLILAVFFFVSGVMLAGSSTVYCAEEDFLPAPSSPADNYRLGAGDLF